MKPSQWDSAKDGIFSEPVVDVVLLSWNRASLTIETIENLQSQKDVQVNIFIVDQGSNESDLELLRKRVDASSNILLKELGQNVGVPAGRNIGTRLGNAPYVVSIDNDAIFESSTALKDIVLEFEANKRLGIVGFRIMNFFTGDDDHLSWVYPKALLAQRDQAFLATRFCGCGHAMLRSIFEQAGGYDDDLFFYWEEVDISNRVINLGYELMYLPKIKVLHKVSPEARVRWEEKRFYFLVRNAIYMDYKYNRSMGKAFVLSAGYLAKGMYNGITKQTLKGIYHSIGMCRKVPSSKEAPNLRFNSQAKAYLQENELCYRGSFWSRLRNEVLVRLPGQG